MFVLKDDGTDVLVLLLFQIPFTKDCGSDEVCNSDLVLRVTTVSKATRSACHVLFNM